MEIIVDVVCAWHYKGVGSGTIDVTEEGSFYVEQSQVD